MKKFWNWIKNSDDTRILRLEGPIDEESFWGDEITPQMFRDELESGEGDVTVWINSPGGNVFAAAEIYTMLRDYKGSIWVQRLSVWSSRRRSRHSCPHRLPVLSTLTRRTVPRRMSSRPPLPSMPRTSGT